MSNQPAKAYLAAQLEQLMALPLDTLEDVAYWDKKCAIVQAELKTRFPSFEVELYIWHFFIDSDVRFKDSGYRQRQHQAIAEYIARLRHG